MIPSLKFTSIWLGISIEVFKSVVFIEYSFFREVKKLLILFCMGFCYLLEIESEVDQCTLMANEVVTG